jgi:ABC-2 type transport system ATP-binding protein
MESDSGKVNVLGTDSKLLGPEQFRKIGYVSENQQMPDWMTVPQLLNYCRPMYPNWDREFEKKLLKQFDLPQDTKLKSLSRGQRMKTALLSSLAYRPPLIVLDEPFSGLDPLVRDEFLTGILSLTEQEGWTVWISSHDIDEVEHLADRVAIIDRGRIDLAEEITTLQSRFQQIDLIMDHEFKTPEKLPHQWLHTQSSGRTIRLIDSAYNDTHTNDLIKQYFPQARRHESRSMSLREIFIALAKTYRLQSQSESPSPSLTA